MRKNIFLLAILFLGCFAACDNETPLDSEQYIKQVYLVGAANNVVTRKIPYSSQEQEVFVAAAMGGSKLADKDVNVKLMSYENVIAWYNKKYKYLPADIHYQALDASSYTIPSYSTTIKTGENYARLPIMVKTDGLHCDSLYAVTFKIESVSDFEIYRMDSALILSFELINNYSGLYLLEATRYKIENNGSLASPTAISVIRKLKAVDANTVRFFNDQVAETVPNIANNCLTMTLDQNGNAVLDKWDKFILNTGTCQYQDGVITLNYEYTIDNIKYKMQGTLTQQIEK